MSDPDTKTWYNPEQEPLHDNKGYKVVIGFDKDVGRDCYLVVNKDTDVIEIIDTIRHQAVRYCNNLQELDEAESSANGEVVDFKPKALN